MMDTFSTPMKGTDKNNITFVRVDSEDTVKTYKKNIEEKSDMM